MQCTCTLLTDNVPEMPGKVDIDVKSDVTGLALVALVRELQHYFTVTPLISLHSSRPFPPPTTAIEP